MWNPLNPLLDPSIWIQQRLELLNSKCLQIVNLEGIALDSIGIRWITMDCGQEGQFSNFLLLLCARLYTSLSPERQKSNYFVSAACKNDLTESTLSEWARGDQHHQNSGQPVRNHQFNFNCLQLRNRLPRCAFISTKREHWAIPNQSEVILLGGRKEVSSRYGFITFC